MTPPAPAPEPAPEPGFSGPLTAGIALIFLAARIAHLVVRPTFFDELYTVWMARQPFASIVPHLLHDSGPPLYYALARIPSVDALRWMSIVFATIAFVLVLRRSLVAAALLALYAPAAFYATEARAYALCGLLVAIGVLLWDDDRPFAAAIAFVAAAYAHYYGVLFFPVLLTKGRRGALAFVIACVLFVPGFVLAAHQPAEAMAWNVWQPLWMPLLGVVFAIAVARSWRFAPAVLIPIALAIAFALIGRNVYSPMRFESVLAVPLVLWAASSLERWRPPIRTTIIAALMIAGAVLIVRDMHQPIDPRLRAVRFAGSSPRVVASDYCYLFAAAQLGPRVVAFPPEQGEHPGWYRPPSQEVALAAARSLPANGFVFVGSAFTPELAAVQRARRVQWRFRDGGAVVLWVEPRDLTGTVH